VTNSRQQMRRPRIFNPVKEPVEAQRDEVGIILRCTPLARIVQELAE